MADSVRENRGELGVYIAVIYLAMVNCRWLVSGLKFGLRLGLRYCSKLYSKLGAKTRPGTGPVSLCEPAEPNASQHAQP